MKSLLHKMNVKIGCLHKQKDFFFLCDMTKKQAWQWFPNERSRMLNKNLAFVLSNEGVNVD